MNYVSLAFIASWLCSCSDLAGNVPLSPEVAIERLTVPCIDSYWNMCAKEIGEDYKIGYSPSLQDYGLIYVRDDIQFEMILNHDGTVKTLEIGIGDFIDLENVEVPVVSQATILSDQRRIIYVLQNRELLVWIFHREFENQ